MFGLVRGLGRLHVARTPVLATALRAVHAGRVNREKARPVPKIAETGASTAFEVAEEQGSAKWMTVRNRLGEGTAQVREATFKTDNFPASPRKLRMIANQITGLPIGEAIRQMQFSAKRSSRVIKNSLEWAQAAAIREKKMDPSNMYLKLVRVGKGRYGKKLECKGRGRTGVIRKPTAHMMYMVWEKQAEEKPVPRNALEKALLAGVLPRRKIKGFKLSKKVWTPLDERKPVINPKPFYNW